MSRPELDEILVRITFNDHGQAVKVVRECRGCGGSGPNTYQLGTPLLGSQLGTLVHDHLAHCAKGHDMHPRIMCGLEVTIMTDNDTDPGKHTAGHRMKCLLEKHDTTTRHQFELAIVTSRDR
jgi:hypothetical protein